MDIAEVEHYFAHYKPIFGAHWKHICQLMCQNLPTTLWVHPDRSSIDHLLPRLQQTGHQVHVLDWLHHSLAVDEAFKLGRRLEFRAGLFHLQEATSMLPSFILDPQPKERVLDLCAAPGGKSAQIALMMKNQGTLVVNDLSYARLRALRGIQERLGIYNMVLCAQDGQKFMQGHSECFDKVLVDVPCSCEGTIRKHGRGILRKNMEEFQRNLIHVQRRLLQRALTLCKVGGRVVYSTCTFNPLENEGIVSTLLKQYPHALRLESIHWPGLEEAKSVLTWQGEHYHPDVSRCLRIHPHIKNTGGFFVASFRIEAPLQESNPITWSPPPALSAEEDQYYRQWLAHHYEVDLSKVQAQFTIASNRLMAMVSQDLRLPDTDCQVAGLPVFHRKGKVPHLTQAAALHWGPLIKKNIINLSTVEHVDRFYSREMIAVEGLDTHLQPQALTQGYYLIRYQDMTLGTGFVRHKEDGSVLESHYPKAWRLGENKSALATL